MAAELLGVWAAPSSSQGCIIEGVSVFQHRKDVERVRRRTSGCSEDWSSSAKESWELTVFKLDERRLRGDHVVALPVHKGSL